MNIIIGQFKSAIEINDTVKLLENRGYCFVDSRTWSGIDEARELWRELSSSVIILVEHGNLYTADEHTFNVDEIEDMIRKKFIFTTPDKLLSSLDNPTK